MMQPVCVVARLAGRAKSLPHLDTLLEWVAFRRERGIAPPPVTPGEVRRIKIPLQRSRCERYWLCSDPEHVVSRLETDHVHYRFPLVPALQYGSEEIKAVSISGGARKSRRLPVQMLQVVGGKVVWWAIGDAEGILDHLAQVTHIGGMRAHGLGEVASWAVEPCESWGDGFPVIRDGVPLRALPADTPGVSAQHGGTGLDVIDGPRWMRLLAEPTAPR